MGKTHFSGLAVGDLSAGSFGGAMLCQSVRLAEATTNYQLNFNEQSLIRDIVLTNDAGASIAGTVSLGTTENGTDIFTGALVAGTPSLVLKSITGRVWVESSVAGSTVWITYATGG